MNKRVKVVKVVLIAFFLTSTKASGYSPQSHHFQQTHPDPIETPSKLLRPDAIRERELAKDKLLHNSVKDKENPDETLHLFTINPCNAVKPPSWCLQ